jgi:molybdopterin-guanine dinucleotide biosynthesis protein A
MTTERPVVSPGFLATIQPIVLVGGKSRRFGRDKLREPWGSDGRALVQYPIDTLREVFGRRVKLVGACDPAIEQLADGVIPDLHPGVGPMGGILSALAYWLGPIFVLAGDMPSFTDVEVTALLVAAEGHSAAHAVCACTDRLHPCAGVYTQYARPALETRVSSGNYTLVTALDSTVICQVPVRVEAAVNVNVPAMPT